MSAVSVSSPFAQEASRPTAKANQDPRPLLRRLWVFLMLNYLYADLMGLMDARILAGYQRGEIEGLRLTESFLFGAAVMMEVPILMTLLTDLLPPRVCRGVTLAAGLFKFAAVGASLGVGSPTRYYLFFATIELIATVVLLSVAWRWKPEVAPGNSALTGVESA